MSIYSAEAGDLGEKVAEAWLRYIQKQPEPKRMPIHELERLRSRASDLKEIVARFEQRLGRGPRNIEIVKQFIAVTLQRRLCCWQTFPMNDLPTEILAYIFDLSISSSATDGSLTRSRLTLTSVCSLWRNLVLSSPSLWSVIEVIDRPPFQTSVTCLERAKSAPLEIWVDQRDKNWNLQEDLHRFGPQDMNALMDILVPHIHHIRTMYFLIDTWAATLVALARLRDAPEPRLLDHLEVHRTGSTYVTLRPGFVPREHRVPIVLFGGVAPTLRHVCLNGVHVDWTLSPLQNLQVLEMWSMAMEVMPSVREFRAMLGSPYLQTVIFSGSGPQWKPEDLERWSRIELSNLRTLILWDFAVGYADFILRVFTAPQLRRLSLGNLSGEDFSTLLKTMTLAFPHVTVLSIETLKIRDTPENQGAISSWFQSMPKLRHMKAANVSELLFLVLLSESSTAISETPRPHQEYRTVAVACPNLTTLELYGTEYRVVRQFLEGRSKLGVPIQRLWVSIDWMQRGVSDEERDTLNRLVTLDAHFSATRPELDAVFLVD